MVLNHRHNNPEISLHFGQGKGDEGQAVYLDCGRGALQPVGDCCSESPESTGLKEEAGRQRGTGRPAGRDGG